MNTIDENPLPGAHLDASKMPGHWLLARLGKRVLRPGGLELTHWMLKQLSISPQDHVVELAPGLGATMRLTLRREPASYTGIERDKVAAQGLQRELHHEHHQCTSGTASDTGLEDASATVVYGEAMLTMQTPKQKRAIIREAHRVLASGGRYAIHELGLAPDDLGEETKQRIERELSASIRVGARPLTTEEWTRLLEEEGFEVEVYTTAPMHLLEPTRLIQDEGLAGVLRIAFNVLQDATARKRVLGMRSVFQRNKDHLCAISIIARKP